MRFGEDPRCSQPFREMADVMMRYTNSVPSNSQKRFLQELPLTLIAKSMVCVFFCPMPCFLIR